MEKTFKIKNKITGYVFELPQERCDYLVKNDPYDFEVIDKDYVSPIKEVEKTSVYEQIIENDEPQEKYDYEAMTVKNLLAYAAEKDYDLQGATRKADIIAKIIEIEGK